MSDVTLMIGTRKGMFVARSTKGGGWDVAPGVFDHTAVTAVGIDTSSGRLLAGIEHGHYGPGVYWSDDRGATWHESEEQAIAFPERTEASLARVWQLHPAAAEPGVVYAGVEPSAIFRSEDGGKSFSLIEGLWDHPHRPTWFPGGGGLCLHTILTRPDDPSRITVAMSTGGVYRSYDGGASWAPANKGITADFAPGPPPEYGQCVHKISPAGGNPDRLYLQNHGGVFRSDDAGDTWAPIHGGLPEDNFGFPIVAHPSNPDTVSVFPVTDPMQGRVPVDHRIRVFRSDDAGESWRPLSAGLPTEPSYAGVMRDAMCTDGGDPAGLYFGTRDGCVYASRDEGETWQLVAGHLADVLSVRAAVL
ncbi:MAG: exo-alpha-sialidase [Streptosporangiales bacterium]|nr:exo-alpha-sialidase [Streptosporangiales bacterium]